MKSQNTQILAWLQEGNSLTPMDALNRFGCSRLASRIGELKEMHDIQKEMITVPTRRGKVRVASYFIGKESGTK